MRAIPVVLLALLVPVGLTAQDGTPGKVISDTIYRLAVDSTKYPDQSFVYLLDDGVLRFEPSGIGSRTYRQVIQILKPSAVEQWAEHELSYDPERERLVLNWMRVVTPDGTVLSDKPEVSQDSDVPAAMESPVYQRTKVRRLSLARVAPGTLVDFSYTIQKQKPFLAGDFFTSWRITTGKLVRRSRLVLDTPIGFEPRIKSRNLSAPPRIERTGGRRIMTWAVSDVPQIDFEPFAADSNGVFQSIEIAGGIGWRDIGGWYAGLARDRYQMTPALESKLTGLLAGARTQDDSIRAIHRFVARDVRYVAISLGMGGYQPRSAADVLATGFGDCKDKATLFVTLARRIGLDANPVLINSAAKVDRALPSISQFDHAIAEVERPEGRVYVDLTDSQQPWGGLPPSLKGQFGLLVRSDGATDEVVIPEEDEARAVSRIRVVGAVDTTGYFQGTLEMQVGGAVGAMMRAAFARPLDSTERRQIANTAAAQVYPEAQGDSLQVLDPGDGGKDPRVRVYLDHGRAAQLAGNAAILTLPYGQRTADLSGVIREVEKRRPRRFPIDAGQVSVGMSSEAVFELTLPPGWTAQPLKGADLKGPFGSLEEKSSQDGRVFKILRRQGRAKGNLAPDRVDELIDWLRKLQAASREGAAVAVIRS
jgi:transglutaminase-like putative cysteine protease